MLVLAHGPRDAVHHDREGIAAGRAGALVTWPPQSKYRKESMLLAAPCPLGTLLHGMVRPKQPNLENSSKIKPGVSFYGDFKFYIVSKINYTQYLLGPV